jgi:hypothetical protein
MYVTCEKLTANLKLIYKLIVSPDTSTVYAELCWLTWLHNQEASGQKLCQRAVSEGMTSVERRRTSFNSYVTNLGRPIKHFRHYAFSSLGTPDTPSAKKKKKTLGFRKPISRNIAL